MTDATLADVLGRLGAYHWDLGITLRVDLGTSHALVSTHVVDPNDPANEWSDAPASLDDNGVVTIWHSESQDEPSVLATGKIRDLLGMLLVLRGDTCANGSTP